MFAIVLESISLRTAYREAKHHKSGDVSWWTWLRKSKQPELPVVLLEDIGAEIGLFFALGGVLLAQATDDPRWDAVGSIAIGMLLIVIAITLADRDEGTAHRRVGLRAESRPDRVVAHASRRCRAA